MLHHAGRTDLPFDTDVLAGMDAGPKRPSGGPAARRGDIQLLHLTGRTRPVIDGNTADEVSRSSRARCACASDAVSSRTRRR